MYCKNGDASSTYDEITIYAPSSTSFVVDDLVTIKIMVWRSDPIGMTDFTYQWHDATDKILPATITDITITCGSTAYKKDVVY
jgi:hypothetical protein